MKKILAIILALAAAVCCLTVSVSAAGSFSLKIEADPYTFGSGTLTARVVIDGSTPNEGIDLEIKYPEAFTIESDDDVAWSDDIIGLILKFNDYILVAPNTGRHNDTHTLNLNFACVPKDNKPEFTLAGTVVTIVFKVDESKITSDSDLTLSFTKNDIIGADGKSLTGGTDFDVNPDPEDGKIELTCETHDPELKSDADGHWKECKKCGKIVEEKAKHETESSDKPCMPAKCKGCDYEVPASVEHTPVARHDENQHWEECEVCGTVTKEKEDHTGGEANCTEQAKCSVCGTAYGELDKTKHSWNEGEITKEPTCTKEGVKTYTCTRCSETKTEAVEAVGHTYDDGVITTPATCTKDGVKTYTCTKKCGEEGETKTEAVKATGHTYDDGVITTPATCMKDGVKTYTCTKKCGEEGETKTEVIKALGHDYDEGKITTPATCLKDGVKTYTCKRNCGQDGATKTEAVKATGHKPAAGYKSDATNHWQICENENCDAEDNIINVTAHTYTAGEYEHDAKGHWQVCTVCKAETEHKEHVKGDMTQDESGHWYKCTSCDEKLEFDAHTKATLTAAVEPYKDDNGVKHDGSLAYWHCPDCGKYFLDNDGKKTGVFDDTSSFTVKYQDDCDDLGHTLTVISSNALSHTYMCTRECGFFWTEAHIFNDYGFCSKCGYKIPGFEETKPEDNVQVDSPTEGTEQGGDTEGDEMNADDTDNTADAPAEAPAESEPAPAPAETNPETGLAMSVIPAILAAIALVVKRR